MRHLFRHIQEIHDKISRSERVYIMVDYDGTLTPIANHPSLATLSDTTRNTLTLLARRPRCVLAVVSGRSEENVRRLVGVNGAYYIGNHGLEVRGPSFSFFHPKATEISDNLTHVECDLKEALVGVGGIVLQHKGLSLSVHYRTVVTHLVPRVKKIVRRIVRTYPRLRLTYGKKVLEVRPRVKWDKGKAAEWLIQKIGPGLPVYIGDDKTDEDAFTKLRNGITVLVSNTRRTSAAKYYVNNSEEVLRFLNILTATLQPPRI
ncbi:MAG: trehalose-phosphatase [Thaumarchaeota archaeon]|nr:trehalose-phosphatase [Nitrososphaerota archaeon]